MKPEEKSEPERLVEKMDRLQLAGESLLRCRDDLRDAVSVGLLPEIRACAWHVARELALCVAALERVAADQPAEAFEDESDDGFPTEAA